MPSGSNRLALAVTAANPDYVYMLAGRSSDSGFNGIYRSSDSGLSFATRATSPNLMGWQSNGSDSGGQSWYDLAIAVSPANAEDLYVGGVNIWRSVTGGSTWTINGHWTGSGAPYVHADVHALEFLPGSSSTLFAGCDGGIFTTSNNGTAWTDISNNLSIAQIYRLGLSGTSAGTVITGWQDNGTALYNNNTARRVYGGDGMECFIDPTNNNYLYAELYYGDFKRSSDGGTTWANIKPASAGSADWVTPWTMDPNNPQTLYAGFADVWKSTDRGTTWSKISAFGTSSAMKSLAVAPSNSNYIYTATSNVIYRTANGGASWTNITSGLPVGSAALTYISIDPLNPDKVWVSFSGYSAANKVFATTNGGSTWTNVSAGLPNLPANCLVYEKNSPDRIFVGTDIGVYYTDNTGTGWQPYFTGLPNVIVKELEIFYPTRKLRAATYGRGLWESDLPQTNTVAADFTSSLQQLCPGQTVTFTDQSYGQPTTWSWSFPGGTPASSSLRNPAVTYNTAGIYSVTLTATNASNSNTVTKTGFITVSSAVSLPFSEGFEGAVFAPAGWVTQNPEGDLTWQRSTSVSGFGSSAACALMDNQNNSAVGTKDGLRLPPLNLTGQSNVSLAFDVAYARYNAQYSDTLSVFVSTDCGATYSRVYYKGGSTLSTTGADQVADFMPTAAQWRTETISLGAYAGQPRLLVKFENRTGFGHYLYLDNVRTTSTAAVSPAPTAAFTGTPASICPGSSVAFTSQSTGSPTAYSWSFPGGTPASSSAQNPVVSYALAGTYSVSLTVSNASGSNTLASANYVTVQTVAAPSALSASRCGTGSVTLSASGAPAGSSYRWYAAAAGGTPISGATSATYNTPNLSSSTTYYVSVVTAAGCESARTAATAIISATPAVSASASPASFTLGGSSQLSATGTGLTFAWSGSGLSSATGSSVTATPATAGAYTYTVTGTSTSGCSSTATVLLTATGTSTCSAPAIPVITPGYICNGSGSVTLTATGAAGVTSFNWYATSKAAVPFHTGSTYTTPLLTVSTTYYVTAVVPGGCESLRKTATAYVTPVFTVSSTPAAPVITSGSSVTLSASATTASVAFKWSPTIGLVSANGAEVKASPAVTTTYTVTGTRSTCTASALVVVNVTCPGPLAGGYTINKNLAPSTTNFTSFSALAARLNNCGVGGPVVVTVAAGSGPYAEQIELQQIPGASAANTITLNGNGNALQLAPASSANYLVRLNGTDYVRLQNLTLTSLSATYGRAIELLNQADHNVIQNCTINLSATSTGSSLAGIIASGTAASGIAAASDLQLLGNVINGGYYGISISGLATAKSAGVVINGNQLNGSYYYGMYLLNLNAVQVSNNTVSMRLGNLNSYGLYLSAIDNGFMLKSNQVVNPGRFGAFLINCNSLAGVVRAEISNNMIGGGFQNTGVACYGLYLNNTDRSDIWFNSINLTCGTTSSAALFVAAASTQTDVRNNSLTYSGTSDGYCFYGTTASFTALDYNNYWSTGSKFVYYSGEKADLAALRAVAAPTGHDQNSYVGNPGYISATDLHIRVTSTQLANRAQLISKVSADADGQLKGNLPDIGADEYSISTSRMNGSEGGTALSAGEPLRLEAWPNPFRQNLSVRMSGSGNEPVRLRLLDIAGREVYSLQTTAEAGRQLDLDLPEHLQQGVYILQVQQLEQVQQLKVVKE